jgi:acetone carboxylase gamma subunit
VLPVKNEECNQRYTDQFDNDYIDSKIYIAQTAVHMKNIYPAIRLSTRLRHHNATAYTENHYQDKVAN